LKVWLGAVDQLGVGAAAPRAQVKEEPAGGGRRAEGGGHGADHSTAQTPGRVWQARGPIPCFRARRLSNLGALPHISAFVAPPAGQTLWATSSYWGTRNRQPPTGSTPLVALAHQAMPNVSGFGNRCSVFGQNKRTVNNPGAAVGGGGRRFLVPQYEADDPTGCCAATVHQRQRIPTSPPNQAATKN
jgi:hypothetical protein